MSKKIIRSLKKLAGTGYTDASDEFLNWLLCSNPGMQHKGNIFCFEEAIRNLPANAPLLELGAFAGLSANIMTYLLRKHGRKNTVISVDPWIVRGWRDDEKNIPEEYLRFVGGNTSITRETFAAFIKASYIRNTAFFSADHLPYAFEMTSDAFFASWEKRETLTDVLQRKFTPEEKFGFIYIDGNHDEDFARRDFENADRFLLPGGYLFFDDSEDESPFGSARVAKALEKDPRYELIAKNPNRLFKKR